jgi:hypothetical protein
MNQAVGDKISPCRMSLRVSAPIGTKIHFFPSKFESQSQVFGPSAMGHRFID